MEMCGTEQVADMRSGVDSVGVGGCGCRVELGVKSVE